MICVQSVVDILKQCSTLSMIVLIVKAWELCNSFGTSFITNTFFQQPLSIWLEENVLDETRNFQGISWSLVFSVACCLIWFARNQFIFQKDSNAHLYLFCRTIKLARDYAYQLSLISAAKQKIPNKVIKQVKWNPAPQGWITINTDGSLMGQVASAACGGIARNHEGRFVAAWSVNIENCSITAAELWGVFWGLLIGHSLGFRNICVELDSASALQHISQELLS